MTLAEILLTQVGAAVTRKIIHYWVEDPDFSLQIATSFSSWFTKYGLDVYSASRANRFYQKVQERVAQTLQYIFESEEMNFEEPELIAIANSVNLTIEHVHFSTDIMFEKNLKAEDLAIYFKDNQTSNVTVGLSQDQIYLYERVLVEASDLIIQITATMPRFQEKALKKIFENEEERYRKLELALDKIVKLLEANNTNRAHDQAKKFENRYKQSIGRDLDWMELFGAGSRVKNKQYTLSVAYVSLSVTTKLESDEDNEYDILNVEEALSDKNQLLIFGEAGSGKTTLLKWIAVQIASKKFTGDLESWNDKVPFFIRLRKFSNGNFPNSEQLIQDFANAFIGAKTPDFVTNILEEGRAILLIDGVDEVENRENLKRWILNLLNNYQNTENVIIITSRPTAITFDWLPDFDDTHLQPMELNDINVFIDHWHQAISEEIGVKSEDLEDVSQNIKTIIRDTRTIRNLATNPLLCALLCALHRDMNQKLPEGRRALYDACLQMLIESRDEERRIEFGKYPQLNYEQKLALLQDLAYHMMDNDLSEIDFSDAESRISYRLDRMQNIPSDTSAYNALRLLIDRTGIIREPSKDRVDFTHRTFEEYLTALEINEQNNLPKLVAKATDDKWREVIILSSGVIRPNERDDLIKKLIEVGDNEVKFTSQCYLLAFSCLDTVIDKPEREIEILLNSKIRSILPPQNIEQAKVIANAGAIAIQHLGKYAKKCKANEAVACIRALSLIGEDNSLQTETLLQIRKFAIDSRVTVTRELIRIFEKYDYYEYGETVISQIPATQALYNCPVSKAYDVLSFVKENESIISLHLENKHSAILLRKLPNLRNLIVSTDISFLDIFIQEVNRLHKLQKLFLLTSKTASIDINQLSDMTELSYFWIFSGDITTYEIDVNQIKSINGLTQLGKLSSLQSVFISSNRIDSLSFLANPSLKEVNLFTSSIEEDITEVTVGQNIEVLNLALPQLEELNINQCKNLRKLRVSGNLKSLPITPSLQKLGVRSKNLPKTIEIKSEQLEDLRLDLQHSYMAHNIIIDSPSLIDVELTGGHHYCEIDISHNSRTIKRLKLTGLNTIDFIELTSKLPNLTHLTLSSINAIENLHSHHLNSQLEVSLIELKPEIIEKLLDSPVTNYISSIRLREEDITPEIEKLRVLHNFSRYLVHDYVIYSSAHFFYPVQFYTLEFTDIDDFFTVNISPLINIEL